MCYNNNVNKTLFLTTRARSDLKVWIIALLGITVPYLSGMVFLIFKEIIWKHV